MIKKRLFIKTYGCQMNVYDSQRMSDLLAPFGYEPTEEMAEANMVILNTCNIREKAAEKMYSELGRINKLQQKRLKQNPNDKMVIVIAGCVGQAEGEEIFARAPYVDIIVGPQSYHSLPQLLLQLARDGKHQIELDFIEEAKFDKLPEEVTNNSSSALVSVQEGCDKFCTFCVVPYTRGSEFSRPLEQVYREVMQVVRGGAKEVILLGQNVNAYHGKNSEGEEINLAKLIKFLDSGISGLERIRYTTSHPLEMDEELISLHGSSTKLMPFLHLPIQSGSNKILQAMNRGHSRETYLDIIRKLRLSRPDIVLSSDFIVGFPGETEEDFADTLDIVQQVGYGQCYSFKYSPRPGTPAAVKEQVPEAVKSERLLTLQAELARQQFACNESMVGKVLPVLFDRNGRVEGQLVGKSPYLQSVHIAAADPELLGQIVNVKITNAFASSLSGEVIR